MDIEGDRPEGGFLPSRPDRDEVLERLESYAIARRGRTRWLARGLFFASVIALPVSVGIMIHGILNNDVVGFLSGTALFVSAGVALGTTFDMVRKPISRSPEVMQEITDILRRREHS